jgi:predicted dehydrogenase
MRCCPPQNAVEGIADGGSGRAAGLAVEASKIPGHQFSYLGDIVNDREVEFAIVATPPNVREAVIAPLVGTGKHVLLEKPIACGIKEAVDLVSL